MQTYTDELALKDASTLFDDVFDEVTLAVLAKSTRPTIQIVGFRAAVEAEISIRLQSDIVPRASAHLAAKVESLTALVQLGLKIIERGECASESDHAELKRFLNEASQL